MRGASAGWGRPQHIDRTQAVDDQLLAMCVDAMPMFNQNLRSVDARGWCQDMSAQLDRSHTGLGSDDKGAKLLLRICNKNSVLAAWLRELGWATPDDLPLFRAALSSNHQIRPDQASHPQTGNPRSIAIQILF